MKKQLLALLIGCSTIVWVPDIKSNYWKRLAAAVIVAFLFNKVASKKQSKQAGDCIVLLAPLFTPLVAHQTGVVAKKHVWSKNLL